MSDKINTRLYTDIQSMQELKYSSDQAAAKKEVAQQFEGMLMQMLMRSMRDATKAVSSGMFGSNQIEMYEDLFDKQISMMMASHPLGFDKVIETNIDQMKQQATQSLTEVTTPKNITSHSITAKNNQSPKKELFASKESFIKTLWDGAKMAANALGIMPEVLLAQAALETNWGKSIISKQTGETSYNLFNMKADANWKKGVTEVSTLEHKAGELVKEKAAFKHYNSYWESFKDYVGLLTSHDRYQSVVGAAKNPKQFIEALQQAGFATDPHYADKVMGLLSSPVFNQLIAKVKNI